MSNSKKGKLKVHEDILRIFKPPYWSKVEVSREPRYSADKYKFTPQELVDQKKIHYLDVIQNPCGYCKAEDPKMIYILIFGTNAGGINEYEFHCEKCGMYTFYEEQDFS